MRSASTRQVRLFPAAILPLLLLAGPLGAQADARHVSPVLVGSRVRLLAPASMAKAVQGTVTAMDDGSLLVTTDDHVPVRVQREDIGRLDVSTGRHRQVLKGLIIGTAVGLAIGAVTPPDIGCVDSYGCTDQTKGGMVSSMALGGAAWGAVIGAFLKTDRWSPVAADRLHLSVAPARGRGVAVSLALRFGSPRGAAATGAPRDGRRRR